MILAVNWMMQSPIVMQAYTGSKVPCGQQCASSYLINVLLTAHTDTEAPNAFLCSSSQQMPIANEAMKK